MGGCDRWMVCACARCALCVLLLAAVFAWSLFYREELFFLVAKKEEEYSSYDIRYISPQICSTHHFVTKQQ